MRLLEFITEDCLLEVIPVSDSQVGFLDPDKLVVWRRDGSYFVMERADTVYLSEN